MITKHKTPRLLLTKMDVSHSAELFKIWSDPEITNFMNIESFTHENQAKEMILLFDKFFENEEAIRYSIVELESKLIIGSCGFNYIDFEHAKAEVGYDLNRANWGKGFAGEAITCLIEYAFSDLHLNRIEAKIEPENSNSIRLIEKLNFTYEGTLRKTEKSKNKFVDLMMYSLLATD